MLSETFVGKSTRRSLVLWALLTPAFSLAISSIVPPVHAVELATGAIAPGFTLTSADGTSVSLEAFRGKVVVLEWTNPDCPYVKKHYDSGNMQRLQNEARAAGVVWLTISSAAPGKQGHVEALDALAWIDRQKAVPSMLLLDHKGFVADAYGVKLALHMFIIDPAGRLSYQGAIDDKPTSRVTDVAGARNYVRDALGAMAAGQPASPAVTRPYGCLAR